MAPAKQSKQKRVRRVRKRAPRRSPQGDVARVHHTFAYDTLVGSGQAYGCYNFALTNSNRAISVAKAFQYYRISKVEAFFKPLSDTYIADSVAAGTGKNVPHLYYMIDRNGTFNNANTSITSLKIAGAKPHRIDDNIIKVSWKPAVLIGATDNPTTVPLAAELSAMTKVSPWITTNANAGDTSAAWAPNSVDHLGLAFATDLNTFGAQYDVCSVQFRITYEFKKPFWPSVVVPTQPMNVLDMDVIGGEGQD